MGIWSLRVLLSGKAMDAVMNRKMHVLLTKLGMDADDKRSVVREFTKGRTTSSKEMSDFEARELVNYLQSQNIVEKENRQADKLRKVLIAKAYSIGETLEFVKGWCEKFGTGNVKRGFNEYTVPELHALIDKFDKVVVHRIDKIGGVSIDSSLR